MFLIYDHNGCEGNDGCLSFAADQKALMRYAREHYLDRHPEETDIERIGLQEVMVFDLDGFSLGEGAFILGTEYAQSDGSYKVPWRPITEVLRFKKVTTLVVSEIGDGA